MDEEMRSLGYLCPKCGKTVMGVRSVFALKSSNVEVACSCGKSALNVSFDGIVYRLTVPCGLCGETHTAVCPPERLLQGGTALSCARTKQFVCFVGSQEIVERKLEELKILAEKEKNGDTFSDNVIMYEILSELKDIAGRKGGITCQCGSERYGMEIRRSFVDLICRDCGARLRIPAATDRDLDDLCCHMTLTIPHP